LPATHPTSYTKQNHFGAYAVWTIIEVINFALRKTGIAASVQGLYATPDMIESALQDYIPMVQQFAQEMNIRPYIANPPDVNDYTGLSDTASQAMAYQLGLRICPDYLVEPSEMFKSIASETLESLKNTLIIVPELQRRNDMPFGQGWKSSGRWGEFYQQSNVAGGSIAQPTEDSQTYTIDFTGNLLAGESVVSFQLRDKSDDTEIEAASLSGNVVTYRVKFTEAGARYVVYQVAGDQNTVSSVRVDFEAQRVRGYSNA
jgi:P22 tail accessory factor